MVKIATINILFELDEWEQRRELLAAGLAAEQPDLIGLQEVKMPEDTAGWLGDRLQMPHIYQVLNQPTEKNPNPNTGIAILSRHPFMHQETLALTGQGKVAQRVQVDINGQLWVLCNGHYYWYPGDSPERTVQVQQTLDWLADYPSDSPIVSVGDFNGTPETEAIAKMRQQFTSAYADHHGQEPDYTCPTPLIIRGWRRIWRGLWLKLRYDRRLKPWRGTLDYIFVRNLTVQDCHLILTEPAPQDPKLYPSDHFGLVTTLHWPT